MDAPPNSSVAGGEKAFIIQPSELTPSRANVGNHGNGVNAQHFKVAQDPIRCDSCDCEERCLNLGRRHDGTSMDVNEGDGFGMEESTMAENQLPSALLGRVLIRVASRSSYDPGASPSWWLPGLDSMLCWSSRHLQYMGPERRVMDRLNQYLSHLLRGHSHRPSRGCGLFPRRFLARYCSCWACGHGCLSCPALAVLSTYFLCRRALALGIAACGSVTGGLVFPSMVRQMLPSTGLPWTVRTIAFVQLATMILANLLARSRIKRRKAGPLVEWSAFKEFEYTFYAAGAFFCLLEHRLILLLPPVTTHRKTKFY
ncbi:MFS monocarboxylate transporter, putative [Metarhizium acridum CQMa 102]|uniref:MFS monocarboxylate transporter, putative n=1 Tax=Metarhizium acridum (strain CQMa 102) TaxID=655827 RepID=E9DVM4_METAQ|nr:MFS monocarboxylate transporter, putative [Metarhizium acridum CQMa 102]EFY92401.1 MFS monocarboxylate transporter, putative [Metarhizium acridum CQMa 102]